MLWYNRIVATASYKRIVDLAEGSSSNNSFEQQVQIYWYTKFCTTQEGFKKHAITTSASTGFAVIFSFQNTSVNFLHVVLNQPGIFTKRKRTLSLRQISR